MKLNNELTLPIELTNSEAEFLNSARLYYEKKANKKNTFANFVKICALKTANEIFQQAFDIKDFQPHIIKATNVNKNYFSVVPGRQEMQRLELKHFIKEFKATAIFDVDKIIEKVNGELIRKNNLTNQN